MKVVFLFLHTFAIGVSCWRFGKCPEIPSMQGFEASKFAGQWFEVERSFYLLEISVACTNINFTLSKNIFDVEIMTLRRWNKHRVFAYGTAIPMLDNSSIYRYKVNTNLPFSIAKFLPGAGIYKIINTDYDDYAILWYCSNVLFTYNDRIFILGRDRRISEETRIEVYETLKRLNLDPDRLIVSKNANCTLY